MTAVVRQLYALLNFFRRVQKTLTHKVYCESEISYSQTGLMANVLEAHIL